MSDQTLHRERRDARGVKPMGRRTARFIEAAIITLCLAGLFCVFQPFAVELFSAGVIMVVAGALLFNLIPFCDPARPLSDIVKVLLWVLGILAVAILLAIGSAELYVIYLQER